MTVLHGLELLNYGLVLLFGLFLSVLIAGGWENRRQKRLLLMMCPLLLLLQILCLLVWDVRTVERYYPLIAHVPLILILTVGMKKRVGMALVSVCTAYLCCQLPRWLRLVLVLLTGSELVGELCYTLSIFPIFYLLKTYFVRTAYEAMRYSTRMLVLFGSLPLVYYVFDYGTVVYSDALYRGAPALMEFLPTALIVFYVIFLTAYHGQVQKRTQAELQRSMLEVVLKQAAAETEALRRIDAQTAIYQHDIRHHLTAIQSFLSAGSPQQAEAYIKEVQTDVEAITPIQFCENELISLLCTSFSNKAGHMDVRLTVDARVPKQLPVSDTELCSILSNGLENALDAVSALELPLKWIEVYCGIRSSKLLLEIKNPYAGEITVRDGLPTASREGHGYGCRSIRAICERYHGICTFEPDNGLFTLRVVLPLDGETAKNKKRRGTKLVASGQGNNESPLVSERKVRK